MLTEQQAVEITKTFADSHTAQSFKKGDMVIAGTNKIYEPGDPLQLGIVVKGSVGSYVRAHVNYQAKRTREKIFELFGLFGRYQWFNMAAKQTYGIPPLFKAVSDCQVVLLDEAGFDAADPSVKEAALTMQSLYHLHTSARLYSCGTNLKYRMLMVLWHVRKNSDFVEIPLTMKEIASLARSSFSNIGKHLKEFEEEGLVERNYKNYWIADENKLLNALHDMREVEEE